MPSSRLAPILTVLRKRHRAARPPAIPRDPVAHLYWESVGYLCTDEQRAVAFAALKRDVGLAPAEMLKARISVLTNICALGGIMAPLRARRLQEIAAVVQDEFDGSLKPLLKADLSVARKALRRFPSIGESGADRILMHCGVRGVLGLDSNSHRVLNRLGFGEELKNYGKSYRLTRDAALAELPKTNMALESAHVALRAHGKETCKYSAPRCEECPVTAKCDWFRRNSGMMVVGR